MNLELCQKLRVLMVISYCMNNFFFNFFNICENGYIILFEKIYIKLFYQLYKLKFNLKLIKIDILNIRYKCLIEKII